MSYEVLERHPLYQGPIFSVHKDSVVMPGGSKAYRDVVDHLDAVAIVVLDQDTRIVLVNQYRHPLGERIWELPAGLLDNPQGENTRDAAARELEEEAGVVAESWQELVTVASSPGFTNERVQVYLATHLQHLPRTGTGEDDEEADLEIRWVPLEEAIKMVENGTIVSAHTVAGILAAARKVGL